MVFPFLDPFNPFYTDHDIGRTFIVRTDRWNLMWMQHSINARVQRWFTYLYVFELTQ